MTEITGDWMNISTADLCDAHPEVTRTCEPVFRSYGGRQSFGGPVRTVRVHEDNVLVEEALGEVEPGTVLVVDGGGSKRYALLGGRLGKLAASRGLAGVVVYGCVRDTAELALADVGIMALGPHPRKSRKNGEGERDVVVEFGGLRLPPGDYVYADPDGMVAADRSLGQTH